jgi:hypothetical protein
MARFAGVVFEATREAVRREIALLIERRHPAKDPLTRVFVGPTVEARRFRQVTPVLAGHSTAPPSYAHAGPACQRIGLYSRDPNAHILEHAIRCRAQAPIFLDEKQDARISFGRKSPLVAIEDGGRLDLEQADLILTSCSVGLVTDDAGQVLFDSGAYRDDCSTKLMRADLRVRVVTPKYERIESDGMRRH